MPPPSSYIINGFVYLRDGTTGMANQRIKFINEKTGDSFTDVTNDSGEYITDLANFDRGWQNEQTIVIEILDEETISEWDFYVGTSHSNLIYNYQYLSDLTDWKILTADKSSIKINTTTNPNGVLNQTVYRSPS